MAEKKTAKKTKVVKTTKTETTPTATTKTIKNNRVRNTSVQKKKTASVQKKKTASVQKKKTASVQKKKTTSVQTKKILKEVLDKIKPNSQEKNFVESLVKKTTTKLNKELSKFNAKAVVGGSTAKDTWLKENHEIDIFVLFNDENVKIGAGKKIQTKTISDVLDEVLNKCFSNIQRLKGSRDYFQAYTGTYTLEFIPIVEIKKSEQAKNITDISMLHVEWVKKNVKNKDEVRLLKQFTKANKLYGAESHIKGISGYVLEIITGFYGSFLGVLKGASVWTDKKVIDIKKYHRNVYFSLNKAKLESPLIIIDPVDKERNAAAALGEEKYKEFIRLSKAFLKKPLPKFFEQKKSQLESLKKKSEQNQKIKKTIIILEVKPLEGKSDIVGCKLIKAYEKIRGKLKEFKIKKSGWEWDNPEKAYFWYEFENLKIPEIKEITGPPAEMKQAVENFRKKHKKTFIKNKRIYAKEQRKITNAFFLMEEIIKDKELKVKKIKIL